jgi:hypothetical protein
MASQCNRGSSIPDAAFRGGLLTFAVEDQRRSGFDIILVAVVIKQSGLRLATKLTRLCLRIAVLLGSDRRNHFYDPGFPCAYRQWRIRVKATWLCHRPNGHTECIEI